jgi:acylglycerol lipase
LNGCQEQSIWSTSDNIEIFTRIWIPESEPRAVIGLVHGLGEHSGRYDHVASAVEKAGYALIAMDVRGHGRSGGRRGYIPDYQAVMDDIHRLLSITSQRFPHLPVFLYGHSMGGSLVLNYVLRKLPRLKGVIATSPGLRPGFIPPPWKMFIAKVLYHIWPSFTMANGLELAALSRNPEVVDRYIKDPCIHDRLSARLGVDILNSGEWALEHAREFPLPLLLMHGSADRIASSHASQIFAGSAGATCTFILWEGLFHELHNELEQNEVLQIMLSWLDEQVKSIQSAKF